MLNLELVVASLRKAHLRATVDLHSRVFRTPTRVLERVLTMTFRAMFRVQKESLRQRIASKHCEPVGLTARFRDSHHAVVVGVLVGNTQGDLARRLRAEQFGSCTCRTQCEGTDRGGGSRHISGQVH